MDMPDILRTVESAIELRIRYYLRDAGCAVIALPDNASKMGRATPRGQITVGYRSSTFRTIAESPITMDMTATFEVLIELQNLRSHTGAYPLLDWIRFALTGFIPIVGPVKGMRPASEKIDNIDNNGFWMYSQNWSVPLTVIAGQNPYSPLPIGPEPESQILDPPPYVVTKIGVGVWRNRVGELPNSDEALLDREWEETFS